MESTWDKLEANWPVAIRGRPVSFATLRTRARRFLTARGVVPRAFSHFGVVVSSMYDSLALLAASAGREVKPTVRKRVEEYAVEVARCELDGIEIELLQPDGESMFSDFLGSCGGGLHHLSFEVEDIETCLQRLKNHGVRLIDETARPGSHGKVAFLDGEPVGPIQVELCEPGLSANSASGGK